MSFNFFIPINQISLSAAASLYKGQEKTSESSTDVQEKRRALRNAAIKRGEKNNDQRTQGTEGGRLA